MNGYWKNIGVKVQQKIRNKVGLALYLKRNRIESLCIKCDETLLEEKWAFKEAGCYISDFNQTKREGTLDLSIIVPLYNSEKYIHNCVEGFLNQKTNYKWELILVNDGSGDNTLEMAQKYQREYPDIIIVLNQENRGISGARNAGIEVARGKYIGFADHDDQVDVNFIEKLMCAAYREDADIVKSAFVDIWNGKAKEPQETRDIVVCGEMKKELFDYKSYIFPAIYKRELFEHIRFPKGFWYEDMIVRTLLFRQSKKFVHISDVLYYKNFHTNNASFVVWNLKNYKCIEQLYLVINMIEDNKRLGLQEDVWFYQCIMREFSTILSQRIRGLDEETKQAVFCRACDILETLYKEEYDLLLLESNKLWQRAFSNREYRLWLLLGGYAI